MGTGWRRAFCTTIPRETEMENRSPRSCKKPSSSSSSNPCTPRLKCRTLAEAAAQASVDDTPKLRCKTTTAGSSASAAASPKSTKNSRLPFFASLSNPSSPRSPLKLSLFRNSFKFRNNSCGVCSSSVKTGQGTAIYTAECGHVFHFPCITDHVRNLRALVCPVCNAIWKDVPLLAVHKDLHVDYPQADVTPRTTTNNNVEDKVKFEASPRTIKYVKKEMVSTPKLVESRSYDDDEPLLSPTAGAKFVPIPEADENVEEEDQREEPEQEEEFQGFFVNRSQFSDNVPVDDFRQQKHVEVRLLPESVVVSVGKSHETYAVVVRVKAPSPPPVGWSNPAHRAPIDLVTVLDLSGSMTGAKLQMLKRAMRLVISSLCSADRLSIVGFSTIPKRFLPLRRMTAHGQQSARQIVDRLVCGQGSSVSDALRKAAKVLEDRRERNTVASIMLFSDGHSDRVSSSNQNHRQLAGHASSTRFAHIEIPVLSSGFGNKRGYSHEPAEDAFAKCIGSLLSVMVQDLRIQLGVSSGSTPAEIAAIYTLNGRPAVVGTGAIRLGDLYAEEEKECLVELKVPTSSSGSRHVISVRCCYKDPSTQEIVYCRDRSLLVPLLYTVRSSSPKIERLRNLFLTTRAIAESRRLIDHGDFSSAQQMLATSRSLLMQLGGSSELAEDYVRSLDAELVEFHRRRQSGPERERVIHRRIVDEYGEPLTPTSAWRAAEQLAKVAMMKSMNKVSDLHGFENARF